MDRRKYENAILFFACRVPRLGKVKLNKLLYFADFDHFEKYGQPITGDSYLNNDLGPVPAGVADVLDALQRAGRIEVCAEEVVDYVRYRVKPLAEADLTVFAPSEIEMLCTVANKWGSHSAKEIVIASHGEAPWLATHKGEQIPYPLAYYRGKYSEAEPDYDTEPREEGIPVP